MNQCPRCHSSEIDEGIITYTNEAYPDKKHHAGNYLECMTCGFVRSHLFANDETFDRNSKHEPMSPEQLLLIARYYGNDNQPTPPA